MEKCLICQTDYVKTSNVQKFCSKKCFNDNRNLKRKKESINFHCLICNEEFIQERKDKKTCSDSCSQKLWIRKNPDKDWERHNGIDAKKRSKKWISENYQKFRDIQNKYKNKRREYDMMYKLYENIGNNIRSSLIKKEYRKNTRTSKILGCSFEEFKIHLESKFEPWMNWDNYGKYKKGEYNFGWDIDHIIPTSSANTKEKLLELFHYSNTQPLCSKVNRDEKKNLIW